MHSTGHQGEKADRQPAATPAVKWGAVQVSAYQSTLPDAKCLDVVCLNNMLQYGTGTSKQKMPHSDVCENLCKIPNYPCRNTNNL